MGGKRLAALFCAVFLVILAACGNEPGNQGSTEGDTTTSTDPLAPIAAITVSPVAGFSGAEFVLDASASFDFQDLTEDLEFRWDMENDGEWDNDYSSANIEVTTSIYKSEGTHSVKMKVKDPEGHTDAVVQELEILPADAPSLSGTIEFEKIPVTAQGLDLDNPQPMPARRVLVRSYRTSDDVPLGEDTTDNSGAYSVTALAGEQVYVKVFAKTVDKDAGGNVIGKFMVFPPGDDIPLTEKYIYSAKGDNIQMPGDGNDKTADYLIPDSPNRASGPFNIIDVIEQAYDKVRTAHPSADLNDLVVRWGANYGGGTYYTTSENALYINGKRDSDSDEFDDMIVAHEFGHFVDNNLYRSDSIGGPHYLEERLDPRVAWSEGYATAFAGMTLEERLYRDTCGVNGGTICVGFDIENNASLSDNEGYYNEASVFAILRDLWDDNGESWDTLNYPYSIFGNIWGDTAYKSKTDLIYLYPFVDELINREDNEPATSAILAEENVAYPESERPASTIMEMGTPPASVVGVPIDGGLGNDGSDYEPWDYNTYEANKFYRFHTSGGGQTTVNIKVTCTGIIDFYIYKKGEDKGAKRCAPDDDPPTSITGPVEDGSKYIINVRAWEEGSHTFDLSVTLP